MPKVYIGVGHGGKDPGAVANWFKEADLNLSIALACNEALTRNGVSTMISRTKDESDSLQERINECNAFNPDCAVEIHNNAGGGDGAEIYHAKNNSYDDALAKYILAEIVAIGQNSRGLKTKLIPSTGQDYFGFVRSINAPSVLTECAFIDNKTDLAIIDTPEEQKAMGVAIAKGILKYLGITYKEPTANNVGVLYRVQVGAYSKEENAESMLAKLKKAGFDGVIVCAEADNPKTETTPEAAKKDLAAVAKKVRDGRYGNGTARKNALKAEGFTDAEIEEIQKIVKTLL